MCNNGFGGGNCCWIIILLIIVWCCCGNNSWGRKHRRLWMRLRVQLRRLQLWRMQLRWLQLRLQQQLQPRSLLLTCFSREKSRQKSVRAL